MKPIIGQKFKLLRDRTVHKTGHIIEFIEMSANDYHFKNSEIIGSTYLTEHELEAYLEPLDSQNETNEILQWDDLVIGEIYIDRLDYMFKHTGDYDNRNFNIDIEPESDHDWATTVARGDFRKATKQKILKYQRFCHQIEDEEVSEISMRENQVEELQHQLDEKQVEISKLQTRVNELLNETQDWQRKHNSVAVERDTLKGNKIKDDIKMQEMRREISEMSVDKPRKSGILGYANHVKKAILGERIN